MNIIEADSFKVKMQQRANTVETFLQIYASKWDIPERLAKSMQYSLQAGGKRLRPVLCLSCATLVNNAKNTSKNKIEEIILPFAAAIEMIHTYSLIHDDLPAMDDDDLRRGKPSNHKAFDEATAILAGDALLTDAFTLISKIDLPANLLIKAIGELAMAAGANGMVGGQVLDILYTGMAENAENKITLQNLQKMHSMKTGALIRASCLCGAILADASEEELHNIAAYGSYLGIAFQIIDDILDLTSTEEILGKPIGSDAALGKLTYPALVGLEQSRALALEATKSAENCLNKFSGAEAEFLLTLSNKLLKRVF